MSFVRREVVGAVSDRVVGLYGKNYRLTTWYRSKDDSINYWTTVAMTECQLEPDKAPRTPDRNEEPYDESDPACPSPRPGMCTSPSSLLERLVDHDIQVQ